MSEKSGSDSRRREFKFVPGLRSEYSGDIRAFVLLNHLARQRAGSNASTRSSTSNHSTPKSYLTSGANSPSTKSEKEPGRDQNDDAAGAFDHEIELFASNELPLLPVTSTSWIDPFQSLVLPSNEVTARLLREYVGTEGKMYNLHYDGTFSPQRLILQIAHASTITLAAIYAYTARHQRLHSKAQSGSALVRTEAREHQRLLRLLRDELSKSDEDSFPMGTITGMCGLILAKVEIPETEPGVEPYVEGEVNAHVQGLRTFLLRHGGFLDQSRPTITTWILFWVDIRTSGKVSAGLATTDLYSQHPSGEFISDNLSDDTLPRDDQFISFAASRVVNFYTALYGQYIRNLQKRRLAHFNREISTGTTTPSTTFLRPFSPIHQLLLPTSSAPPRFHEEPSRMALLLMIHIILNHPNDPRWIENTVYSRRNAMTAGGSVQVVLWMLITEWSTGKILDPARLLFTNMVLRVLYDFSEAFVNKFEAALMGFLFYDEEATEMGTMSAPRVDWTPLQMQMDVLTELFRLENTG